MALALVAGWSPHDKTNNMLSCEMAFDLISEVRSLANFPLRLDRNRNGSKVKQHNNTFWFVDEFTESLGTSLSPRLMETTAPTVPCLAD